jgi:ribulose-5-phosphate 4-epimerase/fuculose-1-phosphate aldolase
VLGPILRTHVLAMILISCHISHAVHYGADDDDDDDDDEEEKEEEEEEEEEEEDTTDSVAGEGLLTWGKNMETSVRICALNMSSSRVLSISSHTA